jgi:hypothetical protein
VFWFFFVWLGRFGRAPLRDERGELRLHGEELAQAAWSPGVAALLRGVANRRVPATRKPPLADAGR